MRKPNPSITLKQIRQDAAALQKSRGLTHVDALDRAARNAGFSGWVHARRQLARRGGGAATRFTYCYSDGSGCGNCETVFLSGTLSEADRAAIRAALDPEFADPGSEWPGQFIPSQVGLPDLQCAFGAESEPIPGVDHPWHTIDAMETVRMPGGAVPAMTARELADRFRRVRWVDFFFYDLYDEGWEKDRGPVEGWPEKDETDVIRKWVAARLAEARAAREGDAAAAAGWRAVARRLAEKLPPARLAYAGILLLHRLSCAG